MARSDDDTEKLQNFWLHVFNNSRVNGANYRGENLPPHSWSWPTDTYLQRRRQQLRRYPADEPIIVAQNDATHQCADPMFAAEQTAGPARQIREVVTVERSESEMPLQVEQPTAPQAQTTVIACDDTDEKFSWLAEPKR
jgi:hypothetical protein